MHDNIDIADLGTMTWQEKWYYRMGLFTGFWVGLVIGLVLAVIVWYIRG